MSFDFHNDFSPVYADASVFAPNIWALEALSILKEKQVMTGLVYTDYSDEVASYGQTVNVQLPGEFQVNQKAVQGNVSVQEVSASNIQVSLNQHPEVTFTIEDVHLSKSRAELFSIYLDPAVHALARNFDLICMSQYAQFLDNQSGYIDGLSTSNIVESIVDSRRIMNNNKAPDMGRNLLWNPNSEAIALQAEAFTSAERIGDNGTALREASLGRLYGYNNWMSQNTPAISGAVDEVVGAVNNASGYAAGTTTLTVDGFTGELTAGSFLKIGNAGVFRLVSETDTAGDTTSITIDNGLLRAVADDAVITVSDPAAVNNASGYAAGYIGSIALDGYTNTPVVGQMISFGDSATNPIYVIVKVSGANVTLDRPLESAISDDDSAHLGPNGDYNFGFTREAVALVSRPLALPQQANVTAGIASAGGMAIRVLMTYDNDRLATRVTLDALCGIKTLRSELGQVMLG